MSTAAAAKPELVQAQQVLLERVFIPAFIKECADRGVTFQTVDQVKEALKITGMVNLAQAKSASEGKDPMTTTLKRASQALEMHLKSAGVELPEAEKSAEQNVQIDDQLAAAIGAFTSKG